MRDDKPDIVAELRDLITDWNGADIPDASLPRIDVLCGTIRQAADEITRLRRVVVERNESLLSHERRRDVLINALAGIRLYCNDTLSGRADGGPDDRAWQREAVVEVRNRARDVLENDPAKLADAGASVPKVKALAWLHFDSGDACAHTSVGLSYFARRDGSWAHRNGSYELAGTTLDEAKAAAQADYETRIRSALEGRADG